MTVTAFTPNAFTLFRFQATLDGGTYTCVTTWNVYRQDWYLNIYDQSNTLIVARPFTGSPPPPELGDNLAGGWFRTSTLYYYPATGNIVVSP